MDNKILTFSDIGKIQGSRTIFETAACDIDMVKQTKRAFISETSDREFPPVILKSLILFTCSFSTMHTFFAFSLSCPEKTFLPCCLLQSALPKMAYFSC